MRRLAVALLVSELDPLADIRVPQEVERIPHVVQAGRLVEGALR